MRIPRDHPRLLDSLADHGPVQEQVQPGNESQRADRAIDLSMIDEHFAEFPSGQRIALVDDARSSGPTDEDQVFDQQRQAHGHDQG